MCFGNKAILPAQKISLNVSGLAADVYIAKVYNGKQWTQLKFFKK
jgi:hypothetical protein